MPIFRDAEYQNGNDDRYKCILSLDKDKINLQISWIFKMVFGIIVYNILDKGLSKNVRVKVTFYKFILVYD